MFVFTLHPGREKSLLRRHPWIFSRAVNTDLTYEITADYLELFRDASEQSLQLIKPNQDRALTKEGLGKIAAGELCAVTDSEGKFLCYAHYSPDSQIRLRAISFNAQDRVDYTFVRNLIASACEKRRLSYLHGNKGIRLIAAEGDLMPGLIVDRYNDFLSIACTSCGIEALYEHIIRALHELMPECIIYERSDSKSRLKEKMPIRCGLVDHNNPSVRHNLKDAKGLPLKNSIQIREVKKDDGSVFSFADIPNTLYVLENNLTEIPIDIKEGHKTGGYLDQRASRYRTYELCRDLKALSADGKTGPRVLNCFSYTGGFGLMALKGGASAVFNVDVSDHALNAAKQGVVHNRLDPGRCRFIRKDVFAYLREEAAKGTEFDLVIMDPPKFAEGKSSLASACRGYQDINRLGMQLVKDGGRLLTFSCSGLMNEDLFQKIVSDAALDADCDAQIVGTLRQDTDHPVSMPCPESFYLKGLELIISKRRKKAKQDNPSALNTGADNA